MSDVMAEADSQRQAVRDLVYEMMRASGLDATGLARRSGVSPSTLTRFLNSPDVKFLLSSRTLAKLSAASGVPIPPRLLSPSQVRKTPGYRFKMVRIAVWRDKGGAPQAAADLGLTPEELEDIEADRAEPSQHVLATFCGLAGCPMAFITQGDGAGMRWELAAWLGHLAPELVPGLLRRGTEDQ